MVSVRSGIYPCSNVSLSRQDMVGLNMNTNSQTISTEEALNLISNQHRRKVLHRLIHHKDGSATVDELIGDLHGEGKRSQCDIPVSATQIRIELEHVHLPKLMDAGVIDYDDRDNMIRYRPMDTVETLLTFVMNELS